MTGDAAATLDADGRGLALAGGLAYRGLVALDAEAGRELPAWLELEDGRLLARVDDGGARYPLRIDPWVQSARLTASGRAGLTVSAGPSPSAATSSWSVRLTSPGQATSTPAPPTSLSGRAAIGPGISPNRPN